MSANVGLDKCFTFIHAQLQPGGKELPPGAAAPPRRFVTLSRQAGCGAHVTAEKLAEQGIDAEVIDLRTLRPLDIDTVVDSVKKTNRLVTAEEGWGQSGVGAEVCARVMNEAFDYLDAPPTRVHQVDAPLAYAANLEALALPNAEKIVEAVKAYASVGEITHEMVKGYGRYKEPIRF